MQMTRFGGAVLVAALGALALAGDLEPVAKDSGFAWIDGDDSIPHTVERAKVKKGVPKPGHPRDIIPPIDAPEFYSTGAAAEKHLGLKDGDRVLGLVVKGDARAYPARILDRHEIANDTIGGRPIAVVW